MDLHESAAASGGRDSSREHGPREYGVPLDAASARARAWLGGVFERPIPAQRSIDEVKTALGRTLPERGSDPAEVIERLADGAEPGLMASQSSRFYGWVMGGTFPVALAADWLVSSWDQNAGMRDATPGVVGAEELAGDWLLELLGLPPTADVGFVTGATAANFVGLSAARQHVLAALDWDVNRAGLAGAPAITVLVGSERHGTIDLAARYLGLGEPTAVASDREGRIIVEALAEALEKITGPTIVCLQAGNIHSGAFDDFARAVRIAHDAGAWVHVDGAFGLWAAASPRLRHLTAGFEGADSWASDAHKTLNVPYDCGIAIVANPDAMHTAFGMRASYLQNPDEAEPHDKVPELSRRAHGVPLWATLRWLGRDGVAALVDGLAESAAAIAAGLAELPGVTILNDVVYTQVSMAMADDEQTLELGRRLQQSGEVLASPSRWHDRAVLRFSVSNWATDAAEAARTVDAVRRALPGL